MTYGAHPRRPAPLEMLVILPASLDHPVGGSLRAEEPPFEGDVHRVVERVLGHVALDERRSPVGALGEQFVRGAALPEPGWRSATTASAPSRASAIPTAVAARAATHDRGLVS